MVTLSKEFKNRKKEIIAQKRTNLRPELINIFFNEIEKSNANYNTSNVEQLIRLLLNETGQAKIKRKKRLEEKLQEKTTQLASIEAQRNKLIYNGPGKISPHLHRGNILQDIENTVTNNCFIMGHGSTIKKQYVIIPERVHLKFYVPKGLPLLGNQLKHSLSAYSANPSINLSSNHYLLPDSFTHNMSVSLLSIFKHQKDPKTNKYIFGNTRDHHGIHLVSHSGIFVGSTVKSFYDISYEEYENMGITLLTQPDISQKLLIFSRNIFGNNNIYAILKKSNKNMITIINTLNISIDHYFENYKKFVKNMIEHNFVMNYGYSKFHTNISKYPENLRTLITNLRSSINFPTTISHDALNLIIQLSYYNHNKKEREGKHIMTYNEIASENYNVNLGTILNRIKKYNNDNEDKINLCQGLICRSWDEQIKNVPSNATSSNTTSLNVRLNESENNIGFAPLMRQSSNTGNYKQQFRDIFSRCNRSIEFLETITTYSEINISDIISKYNLIKRMYINDIHYLLIKEVNFLVNLANGYLSSIKNMQRNNLFKTPTRNTRSIDQIILSMQNVNSHHNLFIPEKNNERLLNSITLHNSKQSSSKQSSSKQSSSKQSSYKQSSYKQSSSKQSSSKLSGPKSTPFRMMYLPTIASSRRIIRR